MMLAGQVALKLIPNVEIVTVIIIVCAYAFPPVVSILATLAFCTGEWLIYGYGYWVIAYYIYWPSLAAFSLLLKRINNGKLRNASAAFTAAFFTALFGVLTAAVDTVLASGFSENFLIHFPIIYARGIYFYITHIVSNTIITALLFPLLTNALKRGEKSFAAG